MHTVVDDIGMAHPARQERDARPLRIVSLVPSLTELVCSLGLAGSLVGRTGFCVHPRDVVKRVPKMGGTKDVRIDAIKSLAPTHVLVNQDENTLATYQALQGLGASVFATHPVRLMDNLRLYAQCAALFGCTGSANALADSLRAELNLLADLLPKPSRRSRVLYLIWRKPWMAAGPETYIADLLSQIGWDVHVPTGSGRYPEVAPGSVTVDRVLLSSEPYAFRTRHVAEAEQAFGAPAMCVNGELLSWYGSRAIAGVRYLRELHNACLET